MIVRLATEKTEQFEKMIANTLETLGWTDLNAFPAEVLDDCLQQW